MDQWAIVFLVFWLLTLLAGGAGWVAALLWWYDPDPIAWGSVRHDVVAARALLRITRIGHAGLNAMLEEARRYGFPG
ncbi:MAG TPA: hypothetical protein VN193_11875 [Candidatus Angelobacter sp.]|nr:hypothetical protein [Candidatus Angelobacter sp.]